MTFGLDHRDQEKEKKKSFMEVHAVSLSSQMDDRLSPWTAETLEI